MTDTSRAELIDGIVLNLNQHYVYPDKALAIGQYLQKQLQQGEYRSENSAMALAEKLTDDLQRFSKDRHLEVRYFAEEVPESADGMGQSEQEQAEQLSESRRLNFGFHNVDRLPFNIGYIDLHSFDRPERIAERVAATMTLMADTRALIIDLRRNHGGDPDSVAMFASYLFDSRTHLNDLYMREDNGKATEMWTSDTVPGKKYGSERKVYLLTGEETFSAGEDFAYALKNTKRAVLVGEKTGGGAHPGSPRRITAHFMMNVPSGYTKSPITQTDWEGVGVSPNVEVSEDDALNVAQILILKERLRTEQDAHQIDLINDYIDELD